MNKRFWTYLFTGLFIAGTIISLSVLEIAPLPSKAEEVKLPIYRLSTPTVNEQTVQQLAQKTLGISGQISRDTRSLKLKSGDNLVEVDSKSGGVWVANQAQLWNPKLTPTLPNEATARQIGDAFFKQKNLLPSSAGQQPFSVSFADTSGTYAAFFDTKTKQRSQRKLDVQANYAVKMQIPRRNGTTLTLPVVGGGGDFKLTLGDQGKVINYSGVWRPIAGIETESPIIPKQQADQQFKQLVKGLKLQSFESFLAYYSAPSSAEQQFLYPVYVYRAKAVVDKNIVPLRLITIPATKFGPELKIPSSPLPRTQRDRPQRRSTMPEAIEEEQANPSSVKGMPPKIIAQSSSGYEAGTSWIGPSQGLPGSPKNAQGFVDGLKADGWTINFNWGEGNALESDWRREDDSWVDAADFVFYTGHANMDGWVLNAPDDMFLHWNEVGVAPENPGDLWGEQDLDWIIIAACGPLQDQLLHKKGGSALARWDGAFDGLHQLLGYGAVTYDNEEEGKLVVKYARQGQTLINAWFRAAQEVQPATNDYNDEINGPEIWVGVMYAERSGQPSPVNDHIWGHGSVAPDPTSPTTLAAMWTRT